MPLTPVKSPSLPHRSITHVGLATLISALCGYAVLYLGACDLKPQYFSLFGVFWGAFGLATGATNGFLQEATREVRTSSSQNYSPSRSHTYPIAIAGTSALSIALILVLTARWWARSIFTTHVDLSIGLLASGLICFTIHTTLLGILAGHDQWSTYGFLMVADACVRLLIAVCTFLYQWGLVGYLWATVAGSLAWIGLLGCSPVLRQAFSQRVPISPLRYVHRAVHSLAATAASAILIMGFPVLLKSIVGDLGSQGGVIILAVMLTRAPLLVPLTSMQGNLIAYFVDHHREGITGLLKPLSWVLWAGIGGIVIAGVLGPWLLEILFHHAYQASGYLLAGLTTGAVSIGLLTVTGAATVALALHRPYAIGWVIATIASALFLALPIDLSHRSVIALIFGPLIGMSVHLIALYLGWRNSVLLS